MEDQGETAPDREEEKDGEQDEQQRDDSKEGGDEPGHKIKQAEPEEKAEKETTEDIDRAFD